MEYVIMILIVIIIGLVLYFLLSKKISDSFSRVKLSDEILEYLKATHVRLDSQNRNINDRLDTAAKAIGEMSEIGRNMRELQDFLKSPKLRGNIGEQVLKELLVQMLPKQSFELQHVFKNGEKVDVAITTSSGIVPIDAKFPLENFRKMVGGETQAKRDFERDVKKHIFDISNKYILPAEGTIDYALMYLPSEAIYYEVVNNQTLFDYAGSMRVLPVSPTTFYAYMKAILMSFEGQKIEKHAKEVLSAIHAIQKDYAKVEENLSVLQKHMTNAYNMMTNVFASFTQLGNKLTNVKRLEE